MNVPTYMNHDGEPLPEAKEPARFIVAENGIFLERRSPMFKTSTRVNRFDLNLACHKEYCRLNCGRIPPVMQRAMLGFFQYAHEIHGGEAALVLLYHPERRLFRWHCPEQTIELYKSRIGWVASNFIRFKNLLHLPDGYIQFGDAHLRPGSPVPSAVDTFDDEDGLHIIVGDIATGPSYHVDFVMDGTRFSVPLELIFEDPYCEPFARPPRRWLMQVNLQTTVPLVDEQEIPQSVLQPANNNGERP